MKIHHWITVALLLLFAVSSLAGQIKFRRGGDSNMPLKAKHGEPLWNMSTKKLYMGYSSGLEEIGKTPTVLGNISAGVITAQAVNLSQGPTGQSIKLMEAVANGVNSVTLNVPNALTNSHIVTMTDKGPQSSTVPTHDARYGRGGLIQYQTSSQCRSIPAFRRYTGLMCYAATTDTWRYLKTGTGNTNWSATAFRGYDGRDGALPLFCRLSSGTHAATYDKTGLLPSPAQRAWRAVLYVGGQIVTALRQIWGVGGHLRTSGSATSTAFTPGIQARYSTPQNDFISVQLTYSASTILGGKRYCQVSTPVAISLQAPDGAKGEPGQDVVVTEAAVLSAFAAPLTWSDNALILGALSMNTEKFRVVDENQNSRVSITTNGDANFYEPTQNVQTQITPYGMNVMESFYLRAGIQLNRPDNSKFLDTSATYPITVYGVDPNDPEIPLPVVFQIMSSGKWRGSEGYGTAGLCLQSGGNNAHKIWGSCGTGGGGGVSLTTPLAMRSMQYAVGNTTLKGSFMRYTAVAANRDGFILPSTARPFTIYNHAKRAIFSILSGGGVVIGG